MKIFLVIFFISFGLFAQQENEPRPKHGELRVYSDSKGNKIVEEYDKITKWGFDSPDGLYKKDDPILISRTYYKGQSNIKEKQESYRRLDGSLNQIIYYKNGVKFLEELYYGTEYTILGGKREPLKRKNYYYSRDCMCSEIYDGQKTIQYKIIYKGDKNITVTPTSTIRNLSCKEGDCL